MLALCSFIAVLLGAFLVRSGILNSVHSFAEDPYRGRLLLGMVAAAWVGSMGLYMARMPEQSMTPHHNISWVLRIQTMLLILMALSLLISLLLPLYAEWVQHREITISVSFFEHTTMPLVVPLMMLMGYVHDHTCTRAPRLLWIKHLVLGIGAIGITGWLLHPLPTTHWLLWPIMVLALWTGGTLLYDIAKQRGSYGMWCSHLGWVMLLLGIAWTSTQSKEVTYTLTQGQEVNYEGWKIRYDHLHNELGPNYMARTATLWISSPDQHMGLFKPEVRFYPIEEQYSVEPALERWHLTDVYVTVGNIQQDGNLTLRLYLRPAMIFVWVGSLCMVLGGLISLINRRIEWFRKEA
jgi:cytochrome c-type biogenesis protein CcmF